MIRKLSLYFYNNRKPRKVLEITMVLIYAMVFCLISFSDWLSYSELEMEDLAFQGRKERSLNVITVEVTAEDVAYYGLSADQIAVEVLSKLSVSDLTSVIGLDVDAESLGEDAVAAAKRAADHNNSIVLPEKMIFETEPVIDKMDEATEGILATGVFSPFDNYNTGHNNIILDAGGILRHAVFDIQDVKGEIHSSLVEICCDMYCVQQGLPARPVRVSNQNTAIVRFYDDDRIDYCAADILESRVEAEELDNSIILVGYGNTGHHDVYIGASDYEKFISTLLFDANTAANILEGRLGRSIPLIWQVLLLMIAILALEQLISRLGFFTSICVCAAYELVVQLVVLLFYNIGWVGYSLPHIINGVLSLFIFSGISGCIKNIRKNRELSELLARYVDISIVDDLVKKPVKLKHTSNDAKKEKIAVLFADIRKFTSLSEKTETEKLFDILNEYLSMMANCINKYDGTVDKFIGDCAMGYWVIKGAEYDPIYKACLAAAEMQRRCKELENNSLEKYGVRIEIGIGISFGDAMIGNVGSADRSNYTIIGDTVNVASRLENMAPGGETYISAEAAELLGDRAKCESLGKNITLKNIETPMEVFRLEEISPISVKNLSGKHSDEALEKKRKLKFRMIVSAFIVFSVDFIVSYTAIRENGTGFIIYYSISLAMLSAIIMIINISRCLKEYTGEYRMEGGFLWAVITRLLPVSIHIQLFLMGISCSILGGEQYYHILPGTWALYIVCPVFMIIVWILFGERENYRFSHILLSVAPVAFVIIISMLLSMSIGLAPNYGNMFKIIYNPPSLLLTICLNLAFMVLTVKLHGRVTGGMDTLVRDKNSTRHSLISTASDRLKNLTSGFVSVHVIYIVLNVLIGVLSIRCTIKAYMAGGVSLFSNPSMIGIIVFIVCVLSIIHEIRELTDRDRAEHDRWYRYASYIKMLGGEINFFTIFILAVSGEGFGIFFEPRWNADWTVFLLCPIISFVMWAVEKNDYEIWKCLVSSVPYLCILPISKAAVLSAAATRSYAYEVSNFYETKQIIIIMIGELLSALALCFISRTVAKLLADAGHSGNGLVFSVCGNRHGVVGGDVDNRVYGQHSECYVLRKEDYGLVINAGSGLIQAVDKLIGCTDVDILITSREFSQVMGFLAVSNICPKARIRIFSPYGINTIAAKPYWPVNVVKGIYEKVRVSRKYRLNNDFFVEFEYSDREKQNCMVRITGRTRVCYIGRVYENGSSIDVSKWAYGSNLLIYDAYDNIQDGCYMAIDTNSSYLILTGFRPDVEDWQLVKMQVEANRILSEVSLGKEMEDYLVTS